MKFLSHLDDSTRVRNPVAYQSTVTFKSKSIEGVSFTVQRLSLERRLAMARSVLELSRLLEFKEAGDGAEDKIEANILVCEIEKLYVRWGLVSVAGLTIDGVDATPHLMVEKGPEDLLREIVDAVKAQCGLNQSERKN